MTQHALVQAPAFGPLPTQFRALTPAPRAQALASVLVVDANPMFRQAVRTVLELAGYSVLVAANAQECLRVLGRREVHALIVDFGLTGMDGPRLVQRLRDNPMYGRLPCLLLSGSDSHDDEVRGLEAGADDFIIKSDGFQVLKHRLRAHLRRKAAEDAAMQRVEARHVHELELAEARAAREAEEMRQGLLAVIDQHAAEVERLRLADGLRLCPDLLAELSDALREPLGAIVGFAELLSGELFGPLGNRQRDCVRRILEGARAQLGLVNALLDLTHLETGWLRLARSPINVALLLDAVSGVLREPARTHKITMEMAVPRDLPLVQIDPTRVRQVLHSVLAQGLCDAAPGSTLRVEARRWVDGLEVAVQRVGPALGLDDDDPGAATARRLTFTVARRLAELHGGTLLSQGEGAEVTLRLPAMAAL